MLGRCQKLQDIHIVESTNKFDPKDIRVNEKAMEETERLNYRFVELKEKEESLFEDNFTISYLNIRSLKSKVKDIQDDEYLPISNIISFGETWLNPNDDVQLDGFRGTQENIGRGKGLSAFIKLDINLNWEKISHDTFSVIFMRTEILDVLFLYLSDGFDWQKLKELFDIWIDKKRCVAVMGDTNIDFLRKDHDIKTYMEKNNFAQLVKKPTHEKGGLLDQVYVNEKLMERKPFCTQRSVYFSDHDVVVLHVPTISK